MASLRVLGNPSSLAFGNSRHARKMSFVELFFS